MGFPFTDKYYLRFRHSDVNLTPTFTIFKRTDTHANITPPAIQELGSGVYFFQFTFNTPTDPGIIFEVDGGDAIPVEEVRYIPGTISPKDFFLDQTSSQVSTELSTTGASLTAQITEARTTIVGDLAIVKDAVTDLVPPDNATIAAIKNRVDQIPADLSARISALTDASVRLLGLAKENTVLDQTVFDAQNNMVQGRMRLYNSKATAQSATSAGLLATYSINASYIGQNVQKYSMTKES